MSNLHLMAAHLAQNTAEMIKKFQEGFGDYPLEAPDECQTDYLLQLCQGIEEEGKKGECCATKLHRLMGYVHGVMVSLNLCGIENIREWVHDAKKHYPEDEDVDLNDHNDDDNPFFLDIGVGD